MWIVAAFHPGPSRPTSVVRTIYVQHIAEARAMRDFMREDPRWEHVTIMNRIPSGASV